MGEVKDYIVGLHAVRTFDVHHGQMRPLAIKKPGLWRNGVCEAQCLKGPAWTESSDHAAPALNCSCGIYGALALDSLTNQYIRFTDSVLAIIAAEGKTIVGTRGIRTQRARVVAFWARSMWGNAVGQAQFCDATRYTDKYSMLTDYDIPIIAGGKLDYTDSRDMSWWTGC